MITQDLHGFNVENAIEEVHQLIGIARMSGKKHEVHIITGTGPIKEETMNVLTGYDIEHSVQMGNNGVIRAVVD